MLYGYNLLILLERFLSRDVMLTEHTCIHTYILADYRLVSVVKVLEIFETKFNFLKILRKLSQENIRYLKVMTKMNQDVKETKEMNLLSWENRGNIMYKCISA